MFAQRSIAWVIPQNCLLHSWQLSPTLSVGVRALVAASLPIRLTDLDNPDLPKSSSIASAFSPAASIQSWLHRDLEHLPRGLLLPAPGPEYQPKYGVFGHLSSYLHRSRAAPFFSGLDTLTIEDSRAWLRMTTSGLAHLLAQLVVNAFPGSVLSPVAKVGIDSLPGRKIMWKEAPLAAGTQDIEDGIDNLSAQVISGTPPTFDGRNQWFKDLPLFISYIRWVIGSMVHTTILPTFKTTS